MLQTLPALRTRPARTERMPADPLETRLRLSLCRSSYGHLRMVDCYCQGGAVLLLGQLPSFFLKQMAQETIRLISGVTGIDNQVAVVYEEERAKWAQ